jgi:hypothetical protein
MGFEPMIRVLQTLALPLGHVAVRALFYQRAGVWSSKTPLMPRLLNLLRIVLIQQGAQ